MQYIINYDAIVMKGMHVHIYFGSFPLYIVIGAVLDIPKIVTIFFQMIWYDYDI